MQVDGAARAASEAGIEEMRRIRQRRACREGEFDLGGIDLAGADDTALRLPVPDRSGWFLHDVNNFIISSAIPGTI